MKTLRLLPLLLLAALPARAEGEPTPLAAAFDQFITQSSQPCASRPAAECVSLGWKFLDRDRNGGLTAPEVQRLRQAMGEWLSWKGQELPAQARSGLGLGLLLADGLGVDRLITAFDASADGKVSQAELLADVKLDQRPLGQVLADPAAVDRAALARRVGLPIELIGGLFRVNTSKSK